MTGGYLAEVLSEVVTDPAWLREAMGRVARDPAAAARLFPEAGRHCGRALLRDPDPELAGWTVDDAVRVLLLTTIPLRGGALAEAAGALYRNGDTAEKRAVLRALASLDIADGAAELVHDAIRGNDPRLVAAALGSCARYLDDQIWRQAVLKCVFMDIPLSVIAGLEQRADQELGRMLADLDQERRAAGRAMPADALTLLERIRGSQPVRQADREEEG